jgi:hypothetical protein
MGRRRLFADIKIIISIFRSFPMTALAAKYFTTAEVFAATGVRSETQHQWADRGVTIPSKRDKVSGGSGCPNMNSITNVYQLAITSELAALGVRPKVAAGAARKFTNESQPGRNAGQLFEHFKTVLAITADGASVLNVSYDVTLAEVNNRHACAIVIDLGLIVNQVNETLSKIKGRRK